MAFFFFFLLRKGPWSLSGICIPLFPISHFFALFFFPHFSIFLNKIKKLSMEKAIIEMKRQFNNYEKKFAHQVSEKGIIFKYKEAHNSTT